MKKFLKRVLPLVISAVTLFSAVPAQAAYTPSVTTFKIGLEYGSKASNAFYLDINDESGDGYKFGYYNSKREFVEFGRVNCTDVAVLRDTNMYGTGKEFSTVKSSDSKFTVGYCHIQLNSGYTSYASAKRAADKYTNAFVKCDSGTFYVCVGNYTSKAAAETGAANMGIKSGYEITVGTVYTETLVQKSTGKILFEFDWGTTNYLGVEPYSDSNAKTITRHNGIDCYGGFQFARLTGGSMTCVNVVDVEDYLTGVVPYEMIPYWPKEALKAQAVSARTYVTAHINSHKSNGFDVCNTAHCQVYKGRESANPTTDAAVMETKGKYMLYGGKLCEGYYFSSDGGATETVQNIWSASSPIKYLQGVIDPYEEAAESEIPYYNWKRTFTGEEIAKELKSEGYSCSTIVKCYVSKFTDVGNVYSMNFEDVNGKVITISKSSCRGVLDINSQHFRIYNKAADGTLIDMNPTASQSVSVNNSEILSGSIKDYYSVNGAGEIAKFGTDSVYTINGSGEVAEVEVKTTGGGITEPVSNTFVFVGKGLGHNVGMSQWGAYSMAKYHNKNYEDILKFYYTGITIE